MNYQDVDESLADGRVFELYDNIVLTDIVECAFILLDGVLKDYRGHIICLGPSWKDFEKLLPGRNNIEFADEVGDISTYIDLEKTMWLSQFGSAMAGYEERCQKGFFSYDEIMTLVYMFAYRTKMGDKNPDKKYFLVDPVLPMEGLMSICDKVSLPYAYALANGYIPVISLKHSGQSFYSDYKDDDVWKKFFIQPYGEGADEWTESSNVYRFPYSSVTFSDRWLMKRIIDCNEVSFMNTHFLNETVREIIMEEKRRQLQDPDRTIGVLIRGTDYTVSHLAGHTIMATPEQVMEKIREFELTGKYDHIFLATEDVHILEKMKEYCGDRLIYTNQRRFDIKPGELLADQKANRENDG